MGLSRLNRASSSSCCTERFCVGFGLGAGAAGFGAAAFLTGCWAVVAGGTDAASFRFNFFDSGPGALEGLVVRFARSVTVPGEVDAAAFGEALSTDFFDDEAGGSGTVFFSGAAGSSTGFLAEEDCCTVDLQQVLRSSISSAFNSAGFRAFSLM